MLSCYVSIQSLFLNPNSKSLRKSYGPTLRLVSNTSPPAMSDPNAAYRLWDYVPSVAAGAVAAGVFGVFMIAHIIFLFKKRTYFCIPLAIGAFCTYWISYTIPTSALTSIR